MEMSRRHNYDGFDIMGKDLDDDATESHEIQFNIPLCPRILVSIFGVPLLALVDTGSQVTVISDVFYKYLLHHGEIMELPVSHVMLFTAIGKKTTSVKNRFHVI